MISSIERDIVAAIDSNAVYAGYKGKPFEMLVREALFAFVVRQCKHLKNKRTFHQASFELKNTMLENFVSLFFERAEDKMAIYRKKLENADDLTWKKNLKAYVMLIIEQQNRVGEKKWDCLKYPLALTTIVNRIYEQYKKEYYSDDEMMGHILALIKYELATIEVTLKEASIMQAIRFRLSPRNNKTPNAVDKNIESVKKASL